jgi:putative N6-adenine-specific DNA methylase
MMETLAAAIIELSGWQGDRPLVDPMCGSGTLLCEALMKYCRIPAGYLRERFGLQNLPDHEPELFERIKQEAVAGIRELPQGLLVGNDLSASNLEAAKENSRLLPQGEKIAFRRGDFHELKERKDQLLVCNPPYGRRLKGDAGPERLLSEFGDYLKRNCQGSRALIYVGEKDLLKSVGLRPSWKRSLKNGPLDGRLACYEMY